MISDTVLELKNRVLNEVWEPKETRLFSGAGIVVSDKKMDFDIDTILVITQYAKEVSALIYELKDLFQNYLDFYNKYEFYGRLAESANNFITKQGDSSNVINAIMDEAIIISNEIRDILYFAYGSNMDISQMKKRCQNSMSLKTASAHGYRFELDTKSKATIIEDEISSVQGVLWMITANDLKKLDDYEGISNNCYRREKITVNTETSSETAFVYISQRGKNYGDVDSEYMKKIIEAAKYWGLKNEYICYLEKYIK